MKRITLTFVFVLLAATAGMAAGSYFNSTTFLTQDRAFQLAYVAGVSDALSALAGQSNPSLVTHAYVVRQDRCLDNRGNLGALTDWAIRAMADEVRTYGAASVIIVDACSVVQ